MDQWADLHAVGWGWGTVQPRAADHPLV